MHHRIYPLLIICALVLAIESPAAASRCNQNVQAGDLHEASQVILTGKLVREFAWGPPGFGENPKTDSHWHPWFLRLDRPVRVHFESDSASTMKLTKVQLRGKIERDKEYGQLLGRHVAATGSLWEWSAPADETNPFLDTTEVVSSPEARCPG